LVPPSHHLAVTHLVVGDDLERVAGDLGRVELGGDLALQLLAGLGGEHGGGGKRQDTRQGKHFHR